jgi:nucleotide-binding universal stress UspA family protein
MDTAPVVVGVDGSKHSRRAAVWASAEAVDADRPLHLVYVIGPDVQDSSSAWHDARQALDEARIAVEESGQPIELGSEIVRGDPASVLVDVSRSAHLICLGAKGMHESESTRRGEVAAMIAESAFCPVAIIRRHHLHSKAAGNKWVVAVLDPSPVSHGVLRAALEEGRLRDAPILALTAWPLQDSGVPGTDDNRDLRAELDRYLRRTADDPADVRVCSVPLPTNVTELLAHTGELDQLVIVGKDDAGLITDLVGPDARKLLKKTNCSVMVFRERRDVSLAAS